MPDHRTIRTCRLEVDGMDCPGCAATIEQGLRGLPGVRTARVNFIESRVDVEYEGTMLGEEAITATVSRLGYTPRRAEPATVSTVRVEGASQVTPHRSSSSLPFALVPALSGGLTALGLILSWLALPSWCIQLVYVLAIIIGGTPAARKGLAAVRQHALDMNALMTIAIVGAVAIGEWSEGATVAFLFALANYLETRSMDRARHAIRALMTLSPNTALVFRDGQETVLPVEQLQVGETIIVKPGERIPLDGTVRDGHSTVNQAPITGESVPVDKTADDPVYAGTINGNGALTIRVTALAGDTTLARIIRLVEEAQTRRAPSQRFVDRFARVYTPVVIALAVLIAVIPPVLWALPFTDWLYRALVLLVIACPCALVISTPVAIVSGLTTAARHGVLMKGGLYLEQMAGLTALAFDKTGTLTRGHPSVTDVLPVNGLTETALLQLAASIESRSEHPLACAIVAYARERQIASDGVTMFRALPGRGAQAVVNGQTYYIGNHRLFEERQLCTPETDRRLDALQQQGKTVLIVGSETETLGLIALADRVRDEARPALEALRRAGVTTLMMLTGDHTDTARAIADQLGLDDYRAELLPDEKVAAIEELRAHAGVVGMVGDGINDAPALAAATVGIAMGVVGTDTALETADVALMADDLRMLPYAVRLSRRTKAIIIQNLVTAVLIKILFLILAVIGLATLWMAVMADMGASLLVIFNGLRLLVAGPAGVKPV